MSPALATCSARSGLLHRLKVGERELGIDGLDIGERVDLAGHVHDVLVLEAAHHVGDGVGLADVGKELVAKPLALRRAGDQAGDVDEFDDRGNDFLRLDDVRQRSSRGSGTGTMPTFGSMVQKG